MDVVGVMAAYLPVVRVCTAQSIEALCNAQNQLQNRTVATNMPMEVSSNTL